MSEMIVPTFFWKIVENEQEQSYWKQVQLFTHEIPSIEGASGYILSNKFCNIQPQQNSCFSQL